MKNILSLTLIAMIACPPSLVFANSDMPAMDDSVPFRTAAAASDPLSKLKLSDSPFEACKDKAFLPGKIYNEDKEYWDQAMKECGDQVNLEVLPDDSFFTIKTLLTKLDGSADDQVKAKIFLQEVGAKAKENIAINAAVTQKMMACAEHPKEEGCEKVLKDLAKSIDKVRPALRQELALSNYDVNGQSAQQNEIGNGINRHMGPASAHLSFDAKMEALNDSELGDALDKFKDEQKEFQKSWDASMKQRMEKIEALRKAGKGGSGLDQPYEDAKSKIGQYKDGKFLEYTIAQRAKKFDEHRQAYIQNMMKAPILGYLGEDKAAENCAANGDAKSCHAVLMAATKLHENAIAESQKIDQLLAKEKTATRLGGSRGKTVAEMLPLMKYGPAVRAVLAKDGNYCQSATGLAHLLDNQKSRDNAAIMVGMIGGFVVGGWAAGAASTAIGVGSGAATVMGVSAAAAPAFAVAVDTAVGALAAGAATGYASYKHDAATAQNEEERVMNHATQDDGVDIGDIKDLQEAKEALSMNIALSPMNLMGTGAGAVAGMVGRQATTQIGRASASKVLRAALKEKGHDEAAITKMFTELQSKDPAVAHKASVAMMHDLGMEEDTLKVIQKAASKGLISMTTQRAAAKAIRDNITNASEAKRVMEILEGVNSAKLNDGNRLQALEAALAGAKFGIKEPKYLAAKINDWEQGLDGLTNTYNMAAKKLENKGFVKKYKDLEEAQFHAFDESLDEELMASNAEYKAANAQQRQEIRQQMHTCGVKGK